MQLFGKAKKAPTPDQSIQQLRGTLELLEKRENYVQKKVDDELLQTKKYMAKGNKRAALMCLKRKKAYEAQAEKISGARFTLETQVMALENATVSVSAFDAMRTGAGAMRSIQRDLTIEKVDTLMDDGREQFEVAS